MAGLTTGSITERIAAKLPHMLAAAARDPRTAEQITADNAREKQGREPTLTELIHDHTRRFPVDASGG